MRHYITETCDQCHTSKRTMHPIMAHCDDCDLTLCYDCNTVKDACGTELTHRIDHCGGCNKMICEDDSHYCNYCGQRLCDDCIRHCAECGTDCCSIHWNSVSEVCVGCDNFYDTMFNNEN